MTKSERDKLIEMVGAIAEARRQPMSTTALHLYVMALDDLPFARVQAALLEANRVARFLPTPPELRELAGAGERQRIDRAWELVRRAIRQVGHYVTVDFQDPAINAVLRRMGGWPRVCGADSDWLEKAGGPDFARLYVQECREPTIGIERGPLPGMSKTLKRIPCPWVPSRTALVK